MIKRKKAARQSSMRKEMILDQAPRFHARSHHLAASAASSVVLVTGPQIPQL